MLDNDLIRLNQKVNVILSLRERDGNNPTDDNKTNGKEDVKASLKKFSSNSEPSNNE
jgi:hypothetical protein